MSKTSVFSDVWLGLMMGCDGWSIPIKDPPMRWDDHPAHKPKPIKTSFPVLFLSNTLDPVTPKKAGLIMSKKFKESGFIEQRSEGHCTLAAVSLCTIKKLRAYFKEGIVPRHPEFGAKTAAAHIDADWDTCYADEEPWKPFHGDIDFETLRSATQLDHERLTAAEKKLLIRRGESWKALQKHAAESWSFFGANRAI